MSLSIRCLADHEQDGKDLDLTQNKPDKTEAVTSEGSHHATGLVQEHSRSLDRTHLEKPNEELTTRVGRLNGLIRNWTQRLNAQDLRKTIPVLGMRSLLDQLSQVLFGSHQTKREITFGWLNENVRNVLGVTIGKESGCRIELHPTLTSHLAKYAFPNAFDGRMECRLATLIHELCHAFFQLNRCRQCYNQTGHGDAWQKLAQKVEQVSSKILCVRMDLDRRLVLFCEEENFQRKSRGRSDWEEFNLADTFVGRVAFERPELLDEGLVRKC
jgi:hypothetical protein